MADGYTYLGDVFIGRSYEVKRKYFTITTLGAGVIGNLNTNFQWRIDGGNWESVQPLTSVTAGQNIELKGSIITGSILSNANLPSCKISGNVNSLFYGDSFKNMNVIPTYYDDSQAATYSAFRGLFSGITAVVDASELYIPSSEGFTPHADNYVSGAYYMMFQGCTNLTVAPKLHDALSNHCYSQMFQNCTSLTEVPELPATTMVKGCYYRMFRGCSALNYVKCLAENPDNQQYSSYTEDWLDGSASSGTFVKPTSVTTWHRSGSGIPTGWTIENI